MKIHEKKYSKECSTCGSKQTYVRIVKSKVTKEKVCRVCGKVESD